MSACAAFSDSIASAIEIDGQLPPTHHVPPLLGEHTAEVLAELGYGADDIESLERESVIETADTVAAR